ncbi:helix-turn-helix domain-containing protein [Pseudonocardia sp. ICBG601]|uniref:AraC-like ligand-binding domain-containing protein n=1 Tax=Pseudonocardia sp. ICBG601 TaxID=2846759 RepID=UPI001CF67E59|nr:helix-turn-helix domain-containing protein [Pseudonocardia sp. ICBG601]
MGTFAPGTDAEWSTATVGTEDAFDYWRDIICDTFVQLAARPRSAEPFGGSIRRRELTGLEMSLVDAGPQDVDRTRSLIARSGEECVLASIQLTGAGAVRQDGREARLAPGAMAFYDSTRPYTLSFDRPFRQLVIQVPKASLAGATARYATAVPLPAHGPGRLVSEFFLGLAREPATAEQGRTLVPHALGLLDFALGLAADSVPAGGRSAAVLQRVRRAVAGGAADPQLDADGVAAACGVSRRTLFRALAEDGTTFTALLRAERVRRASELLRARPDLCLPVVAARSGFPGEAQLHRAFRRELDTTPGAFRRTV